MRRRVRRDFAPTEREEASVWTPMLKRIGIPIEHWRALPVGFADRSRGHRRRDPICPPRSRARSRRSGLGGVQFGLRLRARLTAEKSAPARAAFWASGL